MPDKPNKLSRFWHELKRRNVSNVADPLHFPDWVVTPVILLVIIGFPVVAILSWIFDMTPEGLKKTGSAETPEEVVAGSGRRRLKFSDVIIAILVVIICILLYPMIFHGNSLERLRLSDERIAVAVMPFQNMTNDTSWNIWQNGIQFSVITALSNYSSELKVRESESTNYLIRNEGIRNYASLSPDRAEDSFLRAVSLEPENGFWYYYLARHLIDEGLDIDEGLELINKALECIL